jgi:hypothetical protein
MFRLFLLIVPALSATSIATASKGTLHAVSRSMYSRAHSLGDSYKFNPRDGWQHVNVTNLQYKYTPSYSPNLDQQSNSLEKRESSKSRNNQTKKQKHSGKGASIGGSIKHILGSVWNGLKAIGQPEPVIITWCIPTTTLA